MATAEVVSAMPAFVEEKPQELVVVVKAEVIALEPDPDAEAVLEETKEAESEQATVESDTEAEELKEKVEAVVEKEVDAEQVKEEVEEPKEDTSEVVSEVMVAKLTVVEEKTVVVDAEVTAAVAEPEEIGEGGVKEVQEEEKAE